MASFCVWLSALLLQLIQLPFAEGLAQNIATASGAHLVETHEVVGLDGHNWQNTPKRLNRRSNHKKALSVSIDSVGVVVAGKTPKEGYLMRGTSTLVDKESKGEMRLNDKSSPLVVEVSTSETATLAVEKEEERALEPPDYDTVHINSILPELTLWQYRNNALVHCATIEGWRPEHSNTADANVYEAASIYCNAGLDSLVEFYVDPRFKGNYDRLRSKSGWIDKAFLSYMNLREPRDNTSASIDLLVQSIHHFSKYPVVVTNFGVHVPEHMTPERFPRLVLLHARDSATSYKSNGGRTAGFNLNKLTSMLFSKVRGGVVMDADQWANHGIDHMISRAFDGTTKEYPYPVLPVHWMSRDPTSDDMQDYPKASTFTFQSKEAPTKRSLRWSHAHPTWTHYALPWLARWTSYVLAPDTTGAPNWLKEQGFVSDEPLLNFASWADGLTKQWCKFDIPDPSDFDLYLDRRNPEGKVIGKDSKYYPKGIPLVFYSAHAAKDAQASHKYLSRLWNYSHTRKAIAYDGKWFDSGEALEAYDSGLKCAI